MRGACFSALFAALVGGCSESHSSVENCPPGPIERLTREAVSQTELDAALADDGLLSVAECAELCNPYGYSWRTVLDCHPTDAVDAGSREVECRISEPVSCEGRHHASLSERPHGKGPSELAAWLQRAAHAETASVLAFLELRRELAAHGAPEAWLGRCRAAAADEVNHARYLRQLAALHGARPPRVSFEHRRPVRPLLDIALENAVEGAVNETFSGVLARHQALYAEDPLVRAAFAAIAPDEQRHAELAWDLHRWLLAELPRSQHARVQRSLKSALGRVGEPVALGPRTRRTLGLPGALARRRLARGLSDGLSALA